MIRQVEKRSSHAGPPKRRNAKEIRALLIAAATREFADNGYKGGTTAAIARRADVTEAQLYRYFPTKRDLFRAAIFEPLNAHFCAFMDRQPEKASDALEQRDDEQAYIAELQEFMQEHAGLLMSLIVVETHGARDIEGFGAISGLEEYFQRGAAMMRRRHDNTSGIVPELLVRISFAAVMANVLFKDWLFPRGIADDRDIAAAIMDFTIDGLSSRLAVRPGVDSSTKERDSG
ncbi:TetR/AcrR family transcriptional regulator [Novosphingobium beihaiensis]|uniref:TetR/AcrR family transcriptional regulator n=1 Tax=Novosphingobium beihaiensis TaxID=2930389 RepID=A0ABT0BVB5_9SPHN|nr:TetR/AcrR family transcriptional regulator [Novosphingobium beihaiensis]MCJ2189020.1 TetR/AcrR family transcriptional regulator [Novosphingobium beihaiensis]